jgi:hypothetical protein
MSVIPALRRWRPEDHKFQTILGCSEFQASLDLFSKEKRKKKRKGKEGNSDGSHYEDYAEYD